MIWLWFWLSVGGRAGAHDLGQPFLGCGLAYTQGKPPPQHTPSVGISQFQSRPCSSEGPLGNTQLTPLLVTGGEWLTCLRSPSLQGGLASRLLSPPPRGSRPGLATVPTQLPAPFLALCPSGCPTYTQHVLMGNQVAQGQGHYSTGPSSCM